MAGVKVLGRYKQRDGKWSAWMPLTRYGGKTQTHNWGGTMFETMFEEDNHVHQWERLGNVRRDDDSFVVMVWCIDCDETRTSPPVFLLGK